MTCTTAEYTMLRKVFEDSLIAATRVWYRPVCTVHSSIPLLTQKKQVSGSSYPGFICTRFHHILNNDVHLQTTQKLGCPMRPLASIVVPVRQTHQQASQTDDLDKLYKWIEVRCKGHDDAVLESYQMFVSMAAKELGIHIESILKPKKKIQKLTLLKSRHIFKKHRVQYEMRTHFRLITLKHLTGSTADVFLEYIERNLPEGVAMQVKKCHLEKLPSHLTPPSDQDSNAMPSSETADTSSSSSDSSSEDADSSSEEEKHTS